MMRKSNAYRSSNDKEKQKLKIFLPAIQKAAIFYDDSFMNKRIVYYTKYRSIELTSIKSNFMHLCGVNYRWGAHRFFDDILSHRLKLDDISIKNDGTTYQKLRVIDNLPELLSKHVRLVTSGKFLFLKYDYALRTSKQILALTLVSNKNSFLFFRNHY